METQTARAAHRLARMLIEIALAQVKAEVLEVSRRMKAVSGLTDCRNTHLPGADNIASRVQKQAVSCALEEANDEDEEADKAGSDKRESYECS